MKVEDFSDKLSKKFMSMKETASTAGKTEISNKGKIQFNLKFYLKLIKY